MPFATKAISSNVRFYSSMKISAVAITFEYILPGYVQATFFFFFAIKVWKWQSKLLSLFGRKIHTLTSVNRCLQSPDFKIIHPFLHFDVAIKQNEKQKRHIFVDYYPAKSDCFCYCLTQVRSSESKAGNREKNMDVCEERKWRGLEF